MPKEIIFFIKKPKTNTQVENSGSIKTGFMIHEQIKINQNCKTSNWSKISEVNIKRVSLKDIPILTSKDMEKLPIP